MKWKKQQPERKKSKHAREVERRMQQQTHPPPEQQTGKQTAGKAQPFFLPCSRICCCVLFQ
jgi:hypothetical protein